jgi:cell shape-determining protein MreC
MTQFQFDLICKILSAGAPALADELCNSLNTLVQSYNATAEENEQLRIQLAEATSKTANSEEQAN